MRPLERSRLGLGVDLGGHLSSCSNSLYGVARENGCPPRVQTEIQTNVVRGTERHQECSKKFNCEENISKSNNAGALAVGAKQQEYTVIPGGEAGEILPPEGCSRGSRMP